MSNHMVAVPQSLQCYFGRTDYKRAIDSLLAGAPPYDLSWEELDKYYAGVLSAMTAQYEYWRFLWESVSLIWDSSIADESNLVELTPDNYELDNNKESVWSCGDLCKIFKSPGLSATEAVWFYAGCQTVRNKIRIYVAVEGESDYPSDTTQLGEDWIDKPQDNCRYMREDLAVTIDGDEVDVRTLIKRAKESVRNIKHLVES